MQVFKPNFCPDGAGRAYTRHRAPVKRPSTRWQLAKRPAKGLIQDLIGMKNVTPPSQNHITQASWAAVSHSTCMRLAVMFSLIYLYKVFNAVNTAHVFFLKTLICRCLVILLRLHW